MGRLNRSRRGWSVAFPTYVSLSRLSVLCAFGLFYLDVGSLLRIKSEFAQNCLVCIAAAVLSRRPTTILDPPFRMSLVRITR
jgi:hypothetical protein